MKVTLFSICSHLKEQMLEKSDTCSIKSRILYYSAAALNFDWPEFNDCFSVTATLTSYKQIYRVHSNTSFLRTT